MDNGQLSGQRNTTDDTDVYVKHMDQNRCKPVLQSSKFACYIFMLCKAVDAQTA